MAGTATYRVTTTDYEQTHAYITDRRHLESQTDVNSEWGPIREKFSRNQLAAMTTLGEDLTREGIEYLSHMWEPEVLESTDEDKETCPFAFVSYLLPVTRRRNNMTDTQRPQGQEEQQAPARMFACFDADSFVPANQRIVSEALINNGFVGKIVTDNPGNPLPKPILVEDALSNKLVDGTYEKWRKEKNRYPSKVIGEIWLKCLDQIRRRAAEVNRVRTDY